MSFSAYSGSPHVASGRSHTDWNHLGRVLEQRAYQRRTEPRRWVEAEILAKEAYPGERRWLRFADRHPQMIAWLMLGGGFGMGLMFWAWMSA